MNEIGVESNIFMAAKLIDGITNDIWAPFTQREVILLNVWLQSSALNRHF